MTAQEGLPQKSWPLNVSNQQFGPQVSVDPNPDLCLLTGMRALNIANRNMTS